MDFRKTWMNEKWPWNKSRLMDQVSKIDTPLFLEAPLKTAGFPHQILLLILLLFKWIRFSRAEEQRKFKSVVYSRRDIKLINSQSFYLDSSYLRFVESFNIFLSVSGMLLFHGSLRDVQKHEWMKNNFTVLLVWNSFRVNDWVLKLNTPCFKDPAENCPDELGTLFKYYYNYYCNSQAQALKPSVIPSLRAQTETIRITYPASHESRW